MTLPNCEPTILIKISPQTVKHPCAHTLGSDADVASLSADDVKALLATAKAVRPGQVMVVYATDGGAVGAQWWVKG